MKIRNVLIYGYGVMGQAVARTFASHGFQTTVRTRQIVPLELVPCGITVSRTLPTEPPDLVIEFTSEDLETKRRVYEDIEEHYGGADIILATGTSGLDLTELAAKLKRPELFIGIHYFMPAELTTIIEVMAGPAASRTLVDNVADLLISTGKEPIRIYKPVVGFIVNRLQHTILHEAYCLIEEGVASASQIDLGAMMVLAPRMCLNGLLQQKDISGLRIHANAQLSIIPTLHHNHTPNPIPQRLVELGETGLDAGVGFYDWKGLDVQTVKQEASRRLQELMTFLKTSSMAGRPEISKPISREL